MSNRRGRIHSGLIALAVGVLLAGCSSPVPSLSGATRLVIAGDELRVLDTGGTVIGALPYSDDPAAATAFLTELLGSDPVVSTSDTDDNSCIGETTKSLWDDSVAMIHGEMFLPEGQKFWVRATAAEAGGIAVETPQGVTVGQPIDLLEAEIAPEQRNPPIESGGIVYLFVDYDVASGKWVSEDDPEYGSGEYWGARARGENGTIALLGAPAKFVDGC